MPGNEKHKSNVGAVVKKKRSCLVTWINYGSSQNPVEKVAPAPKSIIHSPEMIDIGTLRAQLGQLLNNLDLYIKTTRTFRNSFRQAGLK